MINAKEEILQLHTTLLELYPNDKFDLQQVKSNEIAVIFHNPNRGQPITISLNDFDNEFKVTYFKTPRFFVVNSDGIAALLKALSDYTTGNISYMDIISTSNKTYSKDRLVSISELPEPNLEALAHLCVSKNLISESDLRLELQGGSSVCINFWDTSKNFVYKLRGGTLIKEF